jgi:coenzyme F420-0:L-glutamate ligase / coenzyme F420-1:gamma-L-glutamate ligase
MIHSPIKHHEMTWVEFSSIIKGRRSYKQPFAPDAVPKEMIERCIDLARWAPSAHNSQPWRFVLFYRQEPAHQVVRAQLVEAMGSKYAFDLAKAGKMTAEQATWASATRNQRFLDAPVLVLTFLDGSMLDPYDDQARSSAEMTMGTQSVATALQCLLLALHVIGLEACWYCAPLFADSIVHDVLKVPSTWRAQAFIAAGKAAAEKAVEPRLDGRMPSTERLPVGEIVFDPTQFIAQRKGGKRT